MAFTMVLPLASSSRIRSNMMTLASTAIPWSVPDRQYRAGSGSLEGGQYAENEEDIGKQCDIRDHTGIAVVEDHEQDHHQQTDHERSDPRGWIQHPVKDLRCLPVRCRMETAAYLLPGYWRDLCFLDIKAAGDGRSSVGDLFIRTGSRVKPDCRSVMAMKTTHILTGDPSHALAPSDFMTMVTSGVPLVGSKSWYAFADHISFQQGPAIQFGLHGARQHTDPCCPEVA